MWLDEQRNEDSQITTRSCLASDPTSISCTDRRLTGVSGRVVTRVWPGTIFVRQQRGQIVQYSLSTSHEGLNSRLGLTDSDIYKKFGS